MCGVRWKFIARNKDYGPRDKETWVQIWGLSLTSCETWGKIHNLCASVSSFLKYRLIKVSLYSCFKELVRDLDSGDDTSPHLPVRSQLPREELPPVLPVTAGRKLLLPFPSSPPSLRGANLPGRHLTTTGPHLLDVVWFVFLSLWFNPENDHSLTSPEEAATRTWKGPFMLLPMTL